MAFVPFIERRDVDKEEAVLGIPKPQVCLKQQGPFESLADTCLTEKF